MSEYMSAEVVKELKVNRDAPDFKKTLNAKIFYDMLLQRKNVRIYIRDRLKKGHTFLSN